MNAKIGRSFLLAVVVAVTIGGCRAAAPTRTVTVMNGSGLALTLSLESNGDTHDYPVMPCEQSAFGFFGEQVKVTLLGPGIDFQRSFEATDVATAVRLQVDASGQVSVLAAMPSSAPCS
jgi:hypothetical protein